MLKKVFPNFICFLIFLYVILKPIYLLPSGLPQIADYCLLLLFIVLLFFTKSSRKSIYYNPLIEKKFNCIYFFVTWLTIINVVWSIYLDSFSLIIPIMYYIFNIIAMWVIKKNYYIHGISFFKKMYLYIELSCIIQGLLSLIFYFGVGRATIFFNNPNQLGLYSIICLSYLLILSKLSKNKLLRFVSIIFSLYLIFISLSKAAIISSLALITLYVIFINKNGTLKIVVIILASIALLTGYSKNLRTAILKIPFVSNAFNRIENISNEKDSDFSNYRGYGRIKEIGNHIIYGVGEGAYGRFEIMTNYEIHSAYASILCSYGIVGSILLMFFLYKNISLSFKYCVFFSGILLYGLTHQFWRNTLIWFLIETISILNTVELNKKIIT